MQHIIYTTIPFFTLAAFIGCTGPDKAELQNHSHEDGLSNELYEIQPARPKPNCSPEYLAQRHLCIKSGGEL